MAIYVVQQTPGGCSVVRMGSGVGELGTDDSGVIRDG